MAISRVKVVLPLLLTIVVSGYSLISTSSLPKSQPILAMTEHDKVAKIVRVSTTGKPNYYTFAVTVSSPDKGCDRYANWWEVITPEGKLLYRRVLLHSHVDEQPFTRTGGKVAIESQQSVIVRVHMFPDGYSAKAQKGTVESGFTEIVLLDDFATNLESVEPLPQSCLF